MKINLQYHQAHQLQKSETHNNTTWTASMVLLVVRITVKAASPSPTQMELKTTTQTSPWMNFPFLHIPVALEATLNNIQLTYLHLHLGAQILRHDILFYLNKMAIVKDPNLSQQKMLKEKCLSYQKFLPKSIGRKNRAGDQPPKDFLGTVRSVEIT